nr:hypothetical protein CFP56_30823 [Quercus suber]
MAASASSSYICLRRGRGKDCDWAAATSAELLCLWRRTGKRRLLVDQRVWRPVRTRHRLGLDEALPSVEHSDGW